ncbi:hypothetical protein GN244_ATG16108 [Phytophthora infestans]|uniref:Uncharacterized protein n=1 Tax=Phytophthora infestans TaxID=4787 RepID=A0A833WFH3_PHYIN|nr:hypothetical protein GN244_ATG16108 [Phytophthora infestans]
MRRALVELICQLSATPSCRWAESFESLWWPAVLRPSDFKDEKYLEMVHDIWSKPRFALSTGRPTLESVHMLFQFLQMEHKKLLREEDWQLLRSLRMSTLKREKQRVEICFQLANHVVDTSILRSMADGLREYLVAKTSKEEDTDDYPQVEFEITALYFPNCRFLNGAEDLKLLALIVTLSSSIIRSLMLPGAFFNSLRNPAGLLGFQSFARVGNCLASLCSALRYSSRLTKLSIGHTIRGAHMNSRLDWAWICLAVFHVDSGCELAHFDASGLQLPTYVVEILTAMLASPHPGRTVLLLQDGCLPEGEGCEECELPPNARLFVRLLDGAQAWTSPGASVAWPQLLPETLQPSDFEYEVMEQSEGVVGLLRLLGSSLTSVVVPFCGLDSQALEIILSACPNLTSLNMTGNVMNDLSPLLCAIKKGRCHIESLGVFVECVNATIAAQLQELLLQPNSKCLQGLQLETTNTEADSNNSEKRIWTQIERALASSSLRCLHLSVPPADTYEAATSLITPLHGQILRFITPMRLKIAFLSVVEHASSPLLVSALDHMVLSNVFSFATTSATRRQINVRR